MCALVGASVPWVQQFAYFLKKNGVVMSLRHEYEHQELLASGQTGRAKRLRDWIEAEEKKSLKREDDRVKILVGAAVLFAVQSGHPPDLSSGRVAVLDLMDDFLQRPAERLAVLGEDGQGSDALRRLF